MPKSEADSKSEAGGSSDRPMPVRDAAIYLDITPSSVYKLTSRQEIRHFKPGGKRVFFLEKDLRDYLMRNPVEALAASTE